MSRRTIPQTSTSLCQTATKILVPDFSPCPFTSWQQSRSSSHPAPYFCDDTLSAPSRFTNSKSYHPYALTGHYPQWTIFPTYSHPRKHIKRGPQSLDPVDLAFNSPEVYTPAQRRCVVSSSSDSEKFPVRPGSLFFLTSHSGGNWSGSREEAPVDPAAIFQNVQCAVLEAVEKKQLDLLFDFCICPPSENRVSFYSGVETLNVVASQIPTILGKESGQESGRFPNLDLPTGTPAPFPSLTKPGWATSPSALPGVSSRKAMLCQMMSSDSSSTFADESLPPSRS